MRTAHLPRPSPGIDLRLRPRLPFTRRVIDGSFFPDTGHLNARASAQQTLHQLAADTTAEQFGRRVFVRAVVEVSNFCRENCSYCGMRRDNRALTRFRAKAEQLAELLVHRRPASVTDVNIQAGEDPVVVRETVLPLVRTLRRETNEMRLRVLLTTCRITMTS